MVHGVLPGRARLFVAGRTVTVNERRGAGDVVASGIFDPRHGIVFHCRRGRSPGGIDGTDKTCGTYGAGIMAVTARGGLGPIGRRQRGVEFPRQVIALGGAAVAEGAVFQVPRRDLRGLVIHRHVIGLGLRHQRLDGRAGIGGDLDGDGDILGRIPYQSGRGSRGSAPIRKTGEAALQGALMAGEALASAAGGMVEAIDQSGGSLTAVATHARG